MSAALRCSPPLSAALCWYKLLVFQTSSTKAGSDSGSWSSIYSFVSQNGDLGETFAFLFGDMGTATPYLTFLRTQDESTSTIKWISRDIEALGNKPAVISHIGDISYARAYSWLWDNFFSQVEAVASRVPYHVLIGNHEYDWPLQPCLDVDKFLNKKIEMFEEMSLVYGNDRARGDCAKSFVD